MSIFQRSSAIILCQVVSRLSPRGWADPSSEICRESNTPPNDQTCHLASEVVSNYHLHPCMLPVSRSMDFWKITCILPYVRMIKVISILFELQLLPLALLFLKSGEYLGPRGMRMGSREGSTMITIVCTVHLI